MFINYKDNYNGFKDNDKRRIFLENNIMQNNYFNNIHFENNINNDLFKSYNILNDKNKDYNGCYNNIPIINLKKITNSSNKTEFFEEKSFINKTIFYDIDLKKMIIWILY